MMTQGGVGAAVSLGFVLALYGAPATAQTSPGQARAVPEIIVTANRREESVQDSSLSIGVVDGAEVEAVGIVQATDLPSLVPGLSVSLGGASVQTYLRGVGSFSTDASAESAIAYSINGVYISRPIGLGPIFFDLERIEVVKGPQGTLYGRNASGGAINLITRRPGFQPALEATLSLGSHDLFRAQGAAGTGLTDTLAIRVAGQRVVRDGYLSDGYKDEDSRAARLTTLWRPSPAVSLAFTGELAGQGGMGEAPVKRSLLNPVPSDPWQGPSIGSIQQPPTAFLPGGARFGRDGFLDADLAAASVELEADLGPITLTFVPAYRDVRVKARNYLPGFPFDRHETSAQHSQELRLGSEGGGLSWVAGLYHFRENQTQVYTLRSPPLQQLIVDTPLSTRSYAAFGEATVAVTGSWRLIAGGRFTRERKRQGGTTVTILPAPAVTDNEGGRSFSDFSWKLGLEVDLGAGHMLFATAATGFKAGGFFPSVPAPDNSFGPEELAAYTLGSRNRFLDGRLQLNGEAFYWTYDDKQERFLGATPVGIGLLTTNAGQATLYGGSLDLVFQPSARDSFRGTVEYLRTRYDDFIYRVYNPSVGPFINSFAPEGTGCALGPVVPFTANDAVPALRGDSTQIIDCSGKPLPRAPRWSGSAGYERLVPLGGDARLRAAVDADFASSQFLTPDFIGSGKDDGFVVLSASLTLEEGPLSASAWARNITNEAIYSGGFRYGFSRQRAAGGDPSLFYANIRPPRTYGITLQARF